MRRYNEPIIMTAKLKSKPVVTTPGNAEWLARSRARRLASVHADEAARDAGRWFRLRRGRGCVALTISTASRYLDAVSSWWVNLFGHAHPRSTRRSVDQLDDLEHVMLAGFTHASGGRALRASGGDRARQARPLLLRLRRRIGDRDRAEDELSLLAQSPASSEKPASSPGGRLSRRNTRRACR